ncbi:MAG TPA: RluA family pseudouridine synthase [Candidatus Saccharimonadales bacterium]|nr:RluA family pseudouridine synthase [Candidatus Saccharimonadales bacterium]
MKKVPFYANHDDNMHCSVAVYRMLFDYFLKRKMSWTVMDKMAGFEDGKAPWTVTIWERMSRQGFDIRMIELFDYKRYEKEGDAYLRKYLTKEEYDWQVKHTNVLDIQSRIASFLKQVHVEMRRPTMDDIDEMLDDGRLVFLTVNSRVLNDKEGYVSHAVLVIGQNDKEYIIHDPGLPGQPSRHVPKLKIWDAMGGEQTTSEATGVKYRPIPLRADVVLAQQHTAYSRAALAKLFDKGLVHLGERRLKAGDKIPSNSILTSDLSSLTADDAEIDLPVLYEDDDCVVVNKPAGVLTHAQGAFTTEASVASFLRNKVVDMSGDRAGVVHRLDRATSGVIIGGKNPEALGYLQKQFADRKVKKTYMAIVEGHLKQKEAIIDMPIDRNPKAPATFRVGPNGKPAKTRYKVLEESDKYSLVELKPETGRTHQLRVHMMQLGHPIVGDPLYGKGAFEDRLYLHAMSLEIVIPETEERKTFVAPLPPEFKELMES